MCAYIQCIQVVVVVSKAGMWVNKETSANISVTLVNSQGKFCNKSLQTFNKRINFHIVEKKY